MALIIMVDEATTIREQTLRRPFPLRISDRERDLRAFFNFFCCLEIWFVLNRTSHPDWVKMFGDSNGQIKLPAKQKFQFSFCCTFLDKYIYLFYVSLDLQMNWLHYEFIKRSRLIETLS